MRAFVYPSNYPTNYLGTIYKEKSSSIVFSILISFFCGRRGIVQGRCFVLFRIIFSLIQFANVLAFPFMRIIDSDFYICFILISLSSIIMQNLLLLLNVMEDYCFDCCVTSILVPTLRETFRRLTCIVCANSTILFVCFSCLVSF